MRQLGLGESGKLDPFAVLCGDVSSCTSCPRMAGSNRVLDSSIGPLDSKVLFLGEAPGRLGADASGIPFHGDRAGHNFEELLASAGLGRDRVVVANAIMCAPRDQSGNNATPTSTELANCSGHLGRLIDLVDPAILVSLGRKALHALSLIEPHSVELKEAVRTVVRWGNRFLIPLYHPGQRAMLHRSREHQIADYQFVAAEAKKMGVRLMSAQPALSSRDASVVQLILTHTRGTTYFALHKLCYLADVSCVRRSGKRLLDSYLVRQKNGPYYTALHLAHLRRQLPGLRVRADGHVLRLTLSDPDLFGEGRAAIVLTKEERVCLEAVLSQHAESTEEDLKRSAYLTRPMREILRKERALGQKTVNVPIDLGH